MSTERQDFKEIAEIEKLKFELLKKKITDNSGVLDCFGFNAGNDAQRGKVSFYQHEQ